MTRYTTHRRTLRTAVLSVLTGAALLTPAVTALAQGQDAAASPTPAVQAPSATKEIKVRIGGDYVVTIKHGTPYYRGKVLKRGQTINSDIFLHLSADGKRLYSKTQGGGAPYTIWDAKTGKNLGTQKTDPSKKKVAAKAALTAKASASSVRAWQELRISGKATGMPAHTKVSLQQKQRGTWKALPASTTVNKSGAYTMRVKLGMKGKNELRMVGGHATSPIVHVQVR